MPMPMELRPGGVYATQGGYYLVDVKMNPSMDLEDRRLYPYLGTLIIPNSQGYLILGKDIRYTRLGQKSGERPSLWTAKGDVKEEVEVVWLSGGEKKGLYLFKSEANPGPTPIMMELKL